MKLLTTKEYHDLWNLSTRRIGILCAEGRVPGAIFVAHTWLIPEGTKKPTELKRGPKKKTNS